MKAFEAETLINARSSTVWDIITDGGNYTVWDSGITRIDGQLRNGGPIKVRTRTGGNRTFRLRIQQIPGKVMTWTGGLPWGLFQSVCTFTLTPHGGMTHLRVREEFTGPLLGPMWRTVPDLERAFADYVSAVKKRAELLGRHEARIPREMSRLEGVTGLISVVGAAVLDSLAQPGRLLVARRTAPPHFAGMWEFPGGKVESGESGEQALHRELLEELGVSVRLGGELDSGSADGWPLNERAVMRVWFAELLDGVPHPLQDHDELRWVNLRDRDEVLGLPWIPADLPIVEALLDRLPVSDSPAVSAN